MKDPDRLKKLGLDPGETERLVLAALTEDVGTGDITSESTIRQDSRSAARIVARQGGVVAGLPVSALVFELTSGDIEWEQKTGEGSAVEPGGILALVSGPSRALLTAERVALNFLQHLSGIATLTRRYVDAVAGTGAGILDTRKTTPGLRALEKYAVRTGGGTNHRHGLYDAILIKDNHVLLAGGVINAVAAARENAPAGMTVEVEAATLGEVADAITAGADMILLDNMDIRTLERAVQLIAGRARTEASGGVNLETVRAIAGTGVDLISVGRLTHSAPALDVSMDML